MSDLGIAMGVDRNVPSNGCHSPTGETLEVIYELFHRLDPIQGHKRFRTEETVRAIPTIAHAHDSNKCDPSKLLLRADIWCPVKRSRDPSL